MRVLAQALSVLTLLICLCAVWAGERGCSREAPASALEELAQRVTIALPMPAEPLAGQMRAPCARPQREANGGCWRAFWVGETTAEVASQCARDDVYELEPGGCVKTRKAYLPVLAPKPNSVK